MDATERPEYIDQVHWKFSGPSIKSGNAAKRGFTVVFNLLNNAHKSISANGEVELIVKHRNNSPFSKQRYIFPISTSNFGLSGCLLRHDKPVILDNHFWTVELWFKTTDGRKLYGKSL